MRKNSGKGRRRRGRKRKRRKKKEGMKKEREWGCFSVKAVLVGMPPCEESHGFSDGPKPGGTHVFWHGNFPMELFGLGVPVCDRRGKCV